MVRSTPRGRDAGPVTRLARPLPCPAAFQRSAGQFDAEPLVPGRRMVLPEFP